MPVYIEIFTEHGNVYCIAAKQLLALRRLAFLDRDISHSGNGSELRRRLRGELRTPQVFIDGEHIGGYEELKHHLLYIVAD